jgi:serine/threonine-protein kinase
MTRQSSGPPPAGPPVGSRVGAQVATPVPTGLIGRYQLLDKIGEGGMGSLFLARDPAIDRLVAIKLLRHGLDTQPLRERFSREARAAGRLRHPHIVTVFDVGEHDGDPFIAMEFLAGETLAELIREGARLSLSRRLKLLEELCDGLGYAHRSGLVHRDIKPANLMVDADGVLKILDFGIVRVGDSGMTQAGVLVGTVNYMSPEQVVGSTVDHRSDIFAVGLVSYELISGKQAFSGTMKDGLLNKILNGNPEPLAEVVPGIDAEVVSIVEQALRKDPADRYQDLVRMRNDLSRARMRLEREEELAAAVAAAEAGETAVIGEHATIALEPQRFAPPAIVHEAEQALATGNFRAALTLAGRSTAINPQDRVASSIAARAEAALLDRGRLLQSGTPVTPPAPASNVPAAAIPASGVQAGAGHVMWIAVAIAVAALGVAVAALWFRNPSAAPSLVNSEKRATTAQAPESRPVPAPPSASAPAQASPPPEVRPPAPQPQSTSPDPAPTPPAQEPASEVAARGSASPGALRGGSTRGRPGEAERRPTSGGKSTPPSTSPAPAATVPPPAASAPASPPPSPPAAPERPTGPLRVEKGETSAPKPKSVVEAEATGSGGTVRVELTIGTDGRVSDARILKSTPGLDNAALAAARRWEFQPVRVNGEAFAVIYPVDVIVPPAPAPAPKPAAPAPPSSAPPSADTGRPASPPTVDHRAEIESVLARYKAAWESLDPAALERVQALSAADAAIVRRTMADASRYQVDLAVKAVNVDPSGKSAVVQVTLLRRFTPKIGRAPGAQPASEVRLERRGDGWMITGIR